MFIRVSQMPVQPGKLDEVLALAESIRPATQGMAGLVEYYLVRAGDAELLAIGVWESAAAEQAAGEQLRGALLDRLSRYLAGRPQGWAGEARSIVAR